MKSIIKAGLSCALALTVAAPALMMPTAVEAATKAVAAAPKKTYTPAERAYMKYQSNILYKLRTQTEDMMDFMDQADEYEDDEKFTLLLSSKMDAWEQTLKEAKKYRPQDAPAKFKKAQALFAQAVASNTQTYQLVNNMLQKAMSNQEMSDKEWDIWGEKFVKQYVAFKTKAAAFNEEINKLNKIYK
ncbi:hypothetical protein [Aneurinibacillus sp. REN35]|uniref:hypothetical protein n=1 Tax=Aneurinibacillus sp. REN35 TaxID=3237286 RepID=UPI003529A17B